MNCINCGGSLPAKSDICTYCGTRNDTDLRRFDVLPGEHSGRFCPRCDIEMTTVTVQIGDPINVERCETCFGIFFDPYELEDLIDRTKGRVYEVDYHRMSVLIEEGRKPVSAVKYVQCPVCKERMHRRAYGTRSGVVIDVCKPHGLWLDGGELGAILRWVKLGGLEASGDGVDMDWGGTRATGVWQEEIGEEGAVGGDAPDRPVDSRMRRDPRDVLSAFEVESSPLGQLGEKVDGMVERALDFLSKLLR